MKDRRNRFDPTLVEVPVGSALQQDDEIDLIDLARILIKQKMVLLAILAGFIAAGIVLASLRAPKFEVGTIVQIGSVHKDEKGNAVPIEPASDLVEKIKSAYIPLVMAEFKHKANTQPLSSALDVSVPKGSGVIWLKTDCKARDEASCKEVINSVLQKIKADHQQLVTPTINKLEVKLAAAQNNLKRLQQETQYIAGKKQRILKTAELIAAQHKDKKARLDGLIKNRGKITANNATGALLALQIDNEIKKSQELIDTLEQRLTVGINQELEDADQAEKSNLLAQSDSQNGIKQIQSELANINITREVAPVTMSDKAVGINGIQLLLMFAFGGCFAGLIGAFVKEFMDKLATPSQPPVAVGQSPYMEHKPLWRQAQ